MAATVRLDEKDRRILYQLDINSRASAAEIGRKVGLSKEVVNYRIARLRKRDVIKKFLAVMDLNKLGYVAFKIYLQLQKVPEERMGEIVGFLAKHHNTIFVGLVEGRWDVMVTLACRDTAEFGTMLDEIWGRYESNIKNHAILSFIKFRRFDRPYLLAKPAEAVGARACYFGARAESPNLDKDDIAILVALGEDARTGVAEISKETSIKADAVNARIRCFLKRGVVQQCSLLPNHELIGWPYYKMLTTFGGASAERREEFMKFCEQHQNIIYYIETIGPWQLELDLEVQDSAQLREVTHEILSKFGDLVRDFEPLHCYEEIKYNFFPMGEKLLAEASQPS